MINSAMAVTEAPIFSRLDRLDNVVTLRHLEEIRSCNRSPKTSTPSTPSSGTLTSDEHISSVDFSPKSLDKHCRPIDRVIMETEVKGTLIERLDHLEGRAIKMEEELEAEKQKEEKVDKRAHEKGLKQLVKRAFKARGKHKSRTN